jgi:hypothetical protein
MAKLLGGVLLILSMHIHAAPTVKLDGSNGRVESILNLEIVGTLYNVSFDQAFGSNLFEGDLTGAEAAVDAINAALNDGGHTEVDNAHPVKVPIYYVYTDVATTSGFAGCRTGYIPEYCRAATWEKLPYAEGLGDGSLGATYFALAPVVVIDVLPGNSANKVYPNKSGKLPVAIMSSAEFSAAQVDPATLEFGSAKASPTGTPAIDDIDGQFGDDTEVKFKVQESGIFCDDTEVTLSGETYAGDIFAGTDSIDASNCVSGGCHPY